ncbi:hypothetical protein SHKM778_84270 [Streptomyces sp. KM77-8]|uniref:Carbohydrate ABC transporter permease n=1 Tax=Streptomyces haneummycinicus TaxID=3074435 RepID=A0AAT9HXS6_9ACTN
MSGAKAGEPLGSRLSQWVGGGLVRVFLIVVGLFWLVPTVGLLLASLRTPEDMAADGWWNVFTKPSQLTFGAYETLLKNDDITGSLLNTAYITVPATVLVVVIGSSPDTRSPGWSSRAATGGSSRWWGCWWCRCRWR